MKKYRIAVLDYQSDPGEPWVRGSAKALKNMGHDVSLVILKNRHFNEIQKEWDQNRPDFCLGRNAYVLDSAMYADANSLENYLDEKQIPRALWYLDHPLLSGSVSMVNRWINGNYPKFTFFFSMDRSHESFFTSRNLPFGTLETAIDPSNIPNHPDPSLVKKFSCPVSFVGSPPVADFGEVIESESRIREVYAALAYEDVLQSLQNLLSQLSQEHQNLLQKDIAIQTIRFFQNWYLTPDDYRKAKESLYQASHMQNEQQRAALFAKYDYIYSYSQITLSAFRLRNRGIHIYGGESWKNLMPPGINFHGSVDPLTELPAIYVGSQINLCLTKWTVLSAINERSLLCLASGGFPICDDREDLKLMFEPGEIESFRSLEELEEKTNYYLGNETERKRMIEKGRKRVLENHTFNQRMEKLIPIVANHFNL